jgi:hypothetical protein
MALKSKTLVYLILSIEICHYLTFLELNLGCQTEEIFSPQYFNFVTWNPSISNPYAFDEEDAEMVNLGLSDSYQGPMFNRRLGPDPDSMLQGLRMPYTKEDFLDQNTSFESHTTFTVVPPSAAIRPKAQRHGPEYVPYQFSGLSMQSSHRSIPGTPLSDRSVSTCSKDGSSSVSRYSTLLSSISSPDSTKILPIAVEKSAFITNSTNLVIPQFR